MIIYNYIVIDDEDLDRIAISAYLKKYPFLRHLASFSTATDAKDFLSIKKVDIIFLDIEMPEIDGVTLLSQIRDRVEYPIFITSHTEYALDAFELDVSDYIVKPLKQERIEACVFKLKDRLDAKYKANLHDLSFKKDNLLLKEGTEYISIDMSDVLYLKAMKDYTQIISLHKKTVTIHGNLASILREDRFSSFVRIHKSYAVQKKYIQSIGAKNIIMINKASLPLGNIYKKTILDTYL
ncbi:two-component system LytT family response regulator [Dysgonomonas sp. PFB1-18]|uniref:LytR/AlgR family response regulator transcription factor n=1 Tax=unclassified Dysgonomonas TaxID=2630389 RepID=UPI00247678C9|nr:MULTISPECIES: LytTR family DNA-binding domain-containing protein [unclassified Dysgonomonas]MDH6310875.1 two-component system LytT family response regulator [Dysgonomonas sp. PF1-14]MDH6340687.1 two-component system LytT family response regulator [Dysgonomonas sp. PF1-16]MDH6382345.1 two-component system LytT family response regulator [Dysgonomonas sp. PFB1-18]MDH6399695.1 two-component system LytT family response regulator [Dysgonomonas sp. PF1-23]